MVKNWTVKTQQIKKKRKLKSGRILKSGAFKYGQYLLNEKANSHKKTTIIDLNNAAEKICEIERQIHERTLHRKTEGLRGGGINMEATSFVLSLPKDVKQPTPEEWRKIAADALKAVAKATGIPVSDLAKQAACVLHQEDSENKNTHLNIMIGNVRNNEYLKPLTQHKSTYAVKQSFNASMLALGVDHKLYEPVRPKSGNVPLWLARERKIEEAKDKLHKVNLDNKALIESNKRLIILIQKYLSDFKKYVTELSLNNKPKAVKASEILAKTFVEIEQENKPESIKIHDEIVSFEKEQKVDNFQKSVKKQRKRRRRTQKPKKPTE